MSIYRITTCIVGLLEGRRIKWFQELCVWGGLSGTVVGLVMVLKTYGIDVSSLKYVALAMLTTVYGVNAAIILNFQKRIL